MNRITTLGLILLACLLANTVFSQCVPNPNPTPGLDCGTAPYLCCGEIDNFSGSLPTFNNPTGNNPLCSNGGTAHNTEWVAFAAGTASFNLNIVLSNCDTVGTGGQTFTGVQVGIYGGCDFSEEVFCDGNCQTGAFSIPVSGLQIGQVYFLFFDGCAGSVCDYQITVTGGSTQAPPPGPVTGISGAGIGGGVICEGSTPTYTGNASFTTAFEWSVSGPNAVNWVDNGDQMTIVNWGGPGNYTICATPYNDCYSADPASQLCQTVTVQPDVMQIAPDGFYCENEPGYVFPIDGQTYLAGPHTITIADPTPANCDQVYQLMVNQNFNSTGFFEVDVCQGDMYIFPGNGQFYPPGAWPVDVSPNSFGCDSTLNLTVNQIITTTSINASGTVLDCNTPFITLSAVTPPGSTVSGYQWTTTDGSFLSGETSPVCAVDGPGTYCLEVIYNSFQCTSAIICQTIDPGTAGGPDLTSSVVNASCSTGTNGSATVTPTTPGSFMYTWDVNAASQMTQTASNLAAGTYFVTVEDASGCETVESVLVESTPDVAIAISAENDVDCLNGTTGSATVLGSGGTGLISYQWEAAAGGGTNATANNLAAGTYSVTTMDTQGCEAETMVTIGQPATAVSIAVVSVDDASCNTSDGMIDVTVSGGTGPYTYSWSDGTTITEDLSGAAAGQYELNVLDANLCPIQITETIGSANGPSIGIMADSASCAGIADGALDLTITGGTGPFDIDWDDDALDGIEDPSLITAGTYAVTVTDMNNCEVSGSVTIEEPMALSAVVQTTDSDCNDPTGTLLANPTGGNGGYTYDWPGTIMDIQNPTMVAGGSSYEVTITDIEGCMTTAQGMVAEATPSTGTSAANDVSCYQADDGSVTISMDAGGSSPYSYDWVGTALGDSPSNGNLPPDTYTVIVTDANNCTATFMEVVTEPAELTATVDVFAPDCVGDVNGSATVLPAGGTGSGYTYLWCNSDVGATTTSLPSGACTVILSNNGCDVPIAFTIPDAVAITGSVVASTDVTCFDDDNGTIDVSGGGGSGTLIYNWGGGLPDSPNQTSLEPGNYQVTIEDANGCELELASVTINEPAELTVDVIATSTDCNATTGTVMADVDGGNGGNMYSWDNGAGSDQNPTGLAANTYTVIVTDSEGCNSTNSGIVMEPAAPIGTASSNNVSCYDAADGLVAVSIDLGNGPFTYDWVGYPGLGGDSNSGLEPDTYTVIVEDANGCQVTFMETVTQPDEITATLTPAAPECFGQTNGSALVLPAGGTGSGYTYEWCNGEITDAVNNLPTGACFVEVTNAGCTESFPVMIPDAVELIGSVVANADASCFDADDGTITVTASGGNGTLEYDWGPGLGTTATLTSLPPGNYQATVTDENDCPLVLTEVVINEPAAITILQSTLDATCNMSNGSINIVASGGDGNYTYNWPNAWPDSPDLNGIVPAGNYMVTVNDNSGCELIEAITVSTPNQFLVQGISATEVSCFNGTDGTATVMVSGGNGPYTYDWGPGFPDADQITSLPAGMYEVTIADVDDCEVTASVSIANPTDIQITLENTAATDCLNPTGLIDISASGGTGTLSFLWDNVTPTEDLDMLPPGSYTVVVTDEKLCEATFTQQILAPGLFTAAETVTDVSCAGADDGQVEITVTDGSGNFTYSWPTSTGIGDTNMAGGLEPGNYSVTIDDNGTGCNFTLGVTVDEPAVLMATGLDTDASCLLNDGSIFIDVTGGNGGNMYSWTGPGFTSANEDINNLAPGNYDLQITDAENCVTTLSATIGVPPNPSLTATVANAACAGEPSGSIQLNLVSPNGGGTFSWTGGAIGDTDLAQGLTAGMYSVIVTDAQNCTATFSSAITEPMPLTLGYTEMQASCNDSNGSVALTVNGGTGPFDFNWTGGLPNQQNQTGLAVNSYFVTVTDANLCEEEIETIVTQPSAVTIAETVTNADCFMGTTGSIDLNVSGGNPGYTFLWDDPMAQVVEDPTNLAAGTYSVLVTDVDGCETQYNGVVVDEGNPITITETIVDATCGVSNGGISIMVAGGAGGFSYDWVNPALTDAAVVSNLAVGNYEVVVMDILGCPAQATYSVTSPGSPDIGSTLVPNACAGEAGGSIFLNTIAGTPPFNYDWEDDQYDGMDQVNNLLTATYNVTVTDANNCPVALSLDITEPPALTASVVGPTGVTCAGEGNGSANVMGMGGVPNYSYAWQNGDGDDELTDVAGGTYTVTVTDANLCTAESMVTIDEPPVVAVASNFTDMVACEGDTDGEIFVEGSGGTGAFTYDWSDNSLDGNNNPTALAPGAYLVTVSDANNCSEELSFTIGEPDGLNIDVTGLSDYDGFNVSCAESADGFIDLTVTGGTGTLVYDWSTGDNTASLTNLGVGNYLVTITDASGCVTNWDVPFTGPEPITLAYDVQDVLCTDFANGAIVITGSTGGSGTLLYGLNGGPLEDGILSGLGAGDYMLVAEDANGCESQAYSVEVDEPNPLTVGITPDVPGGTYDADNFQFGDTLTLTSDVSLGGASLDTLYWTGSGVFDCSGPACETIGMTPTETTTYTVYVQDENGCVHEEQIQVRVRKDRNVYVPNAFSPNGDGINESFEIGIGRGVSHVNKFIIVDRWGEIVYEKNDFDPNDPQVDFAWNGQLRGEAMNPGVYVYYMDVKFIDEETVQYKGDITLIR